MKFMKERNLYKKLQKWVIRYFGILWEIYQYDLHVLNQSINQKSLFSSIET